MQKIILAKITPFTAILDVVNEKIGQQMTLEEEFKCVFFDDVDPEMNEETKKQRYFITAFNKLVNDSVQTEDDNMSLSSLIDIKRNYFTYQELEIENHHIVRKIQEMEEMIKSPVAEDIILEYHKKACSAALATRDFPVKKFLERSINESYKQLEEEIKLSNA